MLDQENNQKECAALESKLVEYLDGCAKPADRRAVEEHLNACASCRLRAEEFRSLWGALDDLPEISPSPEFDAVLRARFAAEPAPRRFWGWLPSPRLAFAVTVLVAISVWMSSRSRVTAPSAIAQRIHPAAEASVDSEFGMIRDLPELENYDVISKFDALSELPGPAIAPDKEGTVETR